MNRRRSPRRKERRSLLRQLRSLIPFRQLWSLIPLTASLWFVLLGIPSITTWVDRNPEGPALAMEATTRFFTTPKYSPESVVLSPELEELSNNEDISYDDLRAIIAAAANRPKLKVHLLASHLLGLAKVESNYCRNIGKYVAYDQVKIRLDAAADSDKPLWRERLRALLSIASSLGVDVRSIPGSKAGAISCFQLMPDNWLRYGGGDYEDTFQAAKNAIRHLLDDGYARDPRAAIEAYNPGSGDWYANSVLQTASKWRGPLKSLLLLDPLPINWLTIIAVFTEYLAWYMGEGVEVDFAGEFTDPYPGSVLCGNPFGAVLSPTYIHWAIDKCLPENATGPVVAPHAGSVVFSGFVSRHDERAYDATRDDYISSSGNLIILEATLPDGRWIQSILGHLDPETMPPLGSVFNAGDLIGKTQCGFTEAEYCTNHHLHWAFKIEGGPIDGGIGVNPIDLLD